MNQHQRNFISDSFYLVRNVDLKFWNMGWECSSLHSSRQRRAPVYRKLGSVTHCKERAFFISIQQNLLKTKKLTLNYILCGESCFKLHWATMIFPMENSIKLEILWAILTKWYPPLPHVLYGKVLVLLWETPKSFE